MDEEQPEIVAEVLSTMPLAVRLGIEVTSAQANEVHGRITWREDLCTLGDVMHGGALMALADTVGAVCAVLNLPGGARGTTTIESKTNFFRAVRAGAVEATARPLHVGRSTIVVQTALRRGDGKPVAVTTQTQAVLRS